jgi:hypothetical protein
MQEVPGLGLLQKLTPDPAQSQAWVSYGIGRVWEEVGIEFKLGILTAMSFKKQ